MAVEQKHPAAVKALLDAGADYAAKSGAAGLPRNYIAQKVNTANVEAAMKRLAEAAKNNRVREQLAAEEASGKRVQRLLPDFSKDDLPTIAKFVVQATALADLNTILEFIGPQVTAAGKNLEELNKLVREQLAEANDSDVIVAGLVGRGDGGLTPMVFAAREGDLESAKLLVGAGADLNQTTEYGWTPLLTATTTDTTSWPHGFSSMARMSIFEQRRLDASLSRNGQPQYRRWRFPCPQTGHGSPGIHQAPLDHGANPNLRSKDDTLTRTIFTMQWFFEAGATPFVRAAQSGDIELMKLLLMHGADPGIATDFGDTALAAAAGIGWVEGVTYEHSVKDNLEAVKMLLDLGLDANSANRDGRTPLMGAALKGRSDVVQTLVDHGARLETRDHGSRDTDTSVSKNAGHTWQALDYADGLVRVGVQSAVSRPDTANLIRKLMTERGLAVPPANRIVESICIVEICRERQPAQ